MTAARCMARFRVAPDVVRRAGLRLSTAFGEVDPTDPKNSVIVDISLAPRNARGHVKDIVIRLGVN